MPLNPLILLRVETIYILGKGQGRLIVESSQLELKTSFRCRRTGKTPGTYRSHGEKLTETNQRKSQNRGQDVSR